MNAAQYLEPLQGKQATAPSEESKETTSGSNASP